MRCIFFSVLTNVTHNADFNSDTYLYFNPECKTHPKQDEQTKMLISIRHSERGSSFPFHSAQAIHPSPLSSSLLSSPSVFLAQVRGEYSWSSIDHNVLISDWGKQGHCQVGRGRKFGFSGDNGRRKTGRDIFLMTLNSLEN